MAEATRFWDRHAAGYARRPVPDETVYQRKLAITRSHLTPGTRVLEVGCGTGSTAIAHAPFAGEIVATDISAGMLDIARRKAEEANARNVAFRQVAVEQLDESPGSFDVIMAHSLLHLLADKDTALRMFRHLLKPGGVLVSSTMCLGDRHGWFRFVGPLGKALGVFPLVRVFTGDELRESVRAAGFDIEYDWQPKPKSAVFLIGRKLLSRD